MNCRKAACTTEGLVPSANNIFVLMAVFWIHCSLEFELVKYVRYELSSARLNSILPEIEGEKKFQLPLLILF